MNTAYDNFIRWYKEPLQTLYRNEHAGLPILLITLPLLERYLREKTGLHEELSVNRPKLQRALMDFFPGLSNEEAAGKFWTVFRHGLCHQATLKELPDLHFAGMRNDAPDLHSDGFTFVVSPVKFSKKVIEEIEADFTV